MSNNLTEENRHSVSGFLAHAISILLHPLMMPTLIFGIVFYFCPMAVELPPEASRIILITIFVTTFIFPFLSTFVLLYVIKKNFSVNDFFMENHKERVYPFLFTGFFYAAITFIFIRDHYRPTIIAIMGGIALMVIMIALISYFYKISVHAVGICGVLGYILIISYYYPYEIMIYPLTGVILLAGFLLSARLYLNAHHPSQVFWGALLGLLISAVSFFLFQKLGAGLMYY